MAAYYRDETAEDTGEGMQVFHVYIDDLRFTFVDRAPVEELKSNVVKASRSDGDFVQITQSSRPPSEVFVTSQTKVRIETATIPRDPGDGGADDDDAFWFDFDSLN
jgi:hypothetical protein